MAQLSVRKVCPMQDARRVTFLWKGRGSGLLLLPDGGLDGALLPLAAGHEDVAAGVAQVLVRLAALALRLEAHAQGAAVAALLRKGR